MNFFYQNLVIGGYQYELMEAWRETEGVPFHLLSTLFITLVGSQRLAPAWLPTAFGYLQEFNVCKLTSGATGCCKDMCLSAV